MQNFQLIETLLWEDGAYFLLDLHLERLQNSAHHFNFILNIDEINHFLESTAAALDPSIKYRLRLLLKASGRLQLDSRPLDEPEALPVKIAFSEKKTDKNDVFLLHKTTNRSLYDHELARYRAHGFFDCLFSNQDNEITEGAVTNVIISKDGEHFTPPLSSGVLPGVYRKYFINTGELNLKEKVLYKEDLLNADKILLMNSVRKMVPAILET